MGLLDAGTNISGRQTREVLAVQRRIIAQEIWKDRRERMDIIYEVEVIAQETLGNIGGQELTYGKPHIFAIGVDKDNMTWVLEYDGRKARSGFARLPFERTAYKRFYEMFKRVGAPVEPLMKLQERIVVEAI